MTSYDPLPQTPIRIGGLMRCCIAAALDFGPGVEGQVLDCGYHSDSLTGRMVWRDGAWEWLRDD